MLVMMACYNDLPGDIEVDELGSLTKEDDVSGLDVGMQHAHVM